MKGRKSQPRQIGSVIPLCEPASLCCHFARVCFATEAARFALSLSLSVRASRPPHSVSSIGASSEVSSSAPSCASPLLRSFYTNRGERLLFPVLINCFVSGNYSVGARSQPRCFEPGGASTSDPESDNHKPPQRGRFSAVVGWGADELPPQKQTSPGKCPADATLEARTPRMPRMPRM